MNVTPKGRNENVFIDTNIVLEFKPLEDWDWSILGLHQPSLQICLPIIKELEAAKANRQTGKRKRAKAFLDMLETMEPDMPRQLGNAFLFVSLNRLSERRALELGLPYEDPDEMFVASAGSRWAIQGIAERRIVLSDDTVVRMRTKHYLKKWNAEPMQPPSQYRLGPEPDDVLIADQTKLYLKGLVKELLDEEKALRTQEATKGQSKG